MDHKEIIDCFVLPNIGKFKTLVKDGLDVNTMVDKALVLFDLSAAEI